MLGQPHHGAQYVVLSRTHKYNKLAVKVVCALRGGVAILFMQMGAKHVSQGLAGFLYG